MCFGCLKEPSLRDGSFEYPQHMFWFRNKKNSFQLRTLIWGLINNKELVPSIRYTLAYAPIEDSDQPVHPHSMTIFLVFRLERLEGPLATHRAPIMRMRRLI